jgi:DNA-3-methyladenine glycosylase II
MSEHILAHLSGIDINMGGLIRAVGAYGLVLENDGHPFQALAQAITHQQLNGIAARTILTRFVNLCGNGAFPTPEAVLATPDEALRAAGLSFSKIAALKDLATKTADGVVPDRQTLMDMEDAEIIARLTEVRGIGRWTVEMLLIFQLGRPDILPVDDFGVRYGFQATYGLRKMPAPKALAAYGEQWGPHRTAAAWYLWRAVELKRAGTLPAPQERIRLPRLIRLRRAVRAIETQVGKAKRRKSGSKSATATRKALRKTASTPRRTGAAVRKAKSKRARQ